VASISAVKPDPVRPGGSFSAHPKPSTIGTSTASRAIIVSAMPSRPREKRVPNAGIHSTDISNWKRGVPGPVRNCDQTSATSTSETTENPRPTALPARSRCSREAIAPQTPAPTSGTRSRASSNALIRRTRRR
jgi:hypothetical protein